MQAVFDNDVDYLEILLDHAVAAQEDELEARMGTALEGVTPVRGKKPRGAYLFLFGLTWLFIFWVLYL